MKAFTAAGAAAILLCGCAVQDAAIEGPAPKLVGEDIGPRLELPDDISRFEFPIPRESRIHGYGIVACQAQLDHTLKGCAIVEESPKGYNFGLSALYVARVTSVEPARRQGVPVSTPVRMKITF